MRREHLEALVQALSEPAIVVSSRGEVFAANRVARAIIPAIASESFALASVAASAEDLASYLRLCARSSDPLPGTLWLRQDGGAPAAHGCHAGLLARAEEGRPALVLLRFAPKEGNEPFLQLNQTIARLTEEIRRRREAEERLRILHEETRARSEERFRLLVESVKDYAIFMLDPHGFIASWNTGAERIKGYAAGEIIGKHFSTFYPPEEAASGKCEYELEVATREGRFEEEGWRVRKDGSTFWANVTITALRNPSGDLVGFAKVTRDLTDRRRAEEDLRALVAEKAALAEKARVHEFQERFIAILGHDLRNPLSAIDMGAGVLSQLAARAKDERALRVLDRMRASSRRMSRMIEQILDLTRSRLAGGLEMNPAPMDLRAALTGIVDELRAAHPSREVELRAASPVLGSWDRDRLEQVFSNIVGNAINYGTPETPVLIDVVDGDVVEVSIHNDGPPIADELRSKLFSPFRRGERDSKTAETAGLGLGLYISHEIVTAHGGEIDVRSTASEGTTFRVTLPRRSSSLPSL